MPQILSDIPLWIGFAVMTAAALWIILRPLMVPERRSTGGGEVALYRDQLSELTRDVERGLIQQAEAEAAKLEISRRLLAADAAIAAEKTQTKAASMRLRKITAIGMIVALPVLALAFYLPVGSPNLADQPFAQRMDKPLDALPMEALVLRVEEQVRKNPADIRGREILAGIYLKQERFADAAAEWTRIMQYDGVTAARLAAKGEAELFNAQGNMSAAIRAEFEQAVSIDALEPRAQYYLGVADIQDGKKDAAVARWKKLLASAPKDAEWRPKLEAALADLQTSGPNQDEVTAASGMSAEARQQMIEGMVSRLAARLSEKPEDIEDWLRLIKAYGVLGREDEQKKALAHARQIFAADKSALARLDGVEKP